MNILKVFSLAKKLIDALKLLMIELAVNGKTLIGYLMLEFPELSNYPGLMHALERFAEDPSYANGFRLSVQIILVVGAGHRGIKVLAGWIERLRG